MFKKISDLLSLSETVFLLCSPSACPNHTMRTHNRYYCFPNFSLLIYCGDLSGNPFSFFFFFFPSSPQRLKPIHPYLSSPRKHFLLCLSALTFCPCQSLFHNTNKLFLKLKSDHWKPFENLYWIKIKFLNLISKTLHDFPLSTFFLLQYRLVPPFTLVFFLSLLSLCPLPQNLCTCYIAWRTPHSSFWLGSSCSFLKYQTNHCFLNATFLKHQDMTLCTMFIILQLLLKWQFYCIFILFYFISFCITEI